MGLIVKKVVQVHINCNGDVLHGLFRYKIYELVNLIPEYFISCELQEGEWGTVGSIISWNYLLDGKKQFCKHIIEAVDETNKSITFKAFEGDLMNVYNSFKASFRVEGNTDNSTVTWTFEYEKTSEDVPDPDSLLEAAQNIIKYAETRFQAALNITKDLKIPQLQ